MRRRTSPVFTVAKYAAGAMAAGWAVAQHNWSAMVTGVAGAFALLLALTALEALDFLSKAVDGPERTATRIRQLHLRGERPAVPGAAACMRLRDLTRSGWRPVDWLLRSQDRTNAAITLIVGALVVYFAMVDGVHELLAERWDACGGLGGFLYLLAKWTRRRRGIEVAPQTRNRTDD